MEQEAQQHKTPDTEHTSTAVFFGAVIILTALVLGGLYLWGALLSMEKTSQNSDVADRSTAALSTVSEQIQTDQEDTPIRPSDELEDIERDLNNAPLDLIETLNEFDEIMDVPTDRQ